MFSKILSFQTLINPEMFNFVLKILKQEFLFVPERDLFQFGDIPRSADLQLSASKELGSKKTKF